LGCRKIQPLRRDRRGPRHAGCFAYRLHPVTIGQDGDGDDVTSAVVEPTEPVKRGPVVRGQALTALQALGDVLADRGEVKLGEKWPANRQCVSVEAWREYCDQHSLSSGTGESTRRTAFHKAQTQLQNKRNVRVAADALCMASGDMRGPASSGRVAASDRDLRQAPCKGTH
jgi:hypothetical protein